MNSNIYSRWYKLNQDKSISLVTNPTEVTREKDRIIRRTIIENKVVSTVFLGLDHRFAEESISPIVFETMVFPEEGNFLDEYCERYCTYDDAIKRHEKIVSELKQQRPVQRKDLKRKSKNIIFR